MDLNELLRRMDIRDVEDALKVMYEAEAEGLTLAELVMACERILGERRPRPMRRIVR